jgi:hypothetical protein
MLFFIYFTCWCENDSKYQFHLAKLADELKRTRPKEFSLAHVDMTLIIKIVIWRVSDLIRNRSPAHNCDIFFFTSIASIKHYVATGNKQDIQFKTKTLKLQYKACKNSAGFFKFIKQNKNAKCSHLARVQTFLLGLSCPG